jgi:hypothetical protein
MLGREWQWLNKDWTDLYLERLKLKKLNDLRINEQYCEECCVLWLLDSLRINEQYCEECCVLWLLVTANVPSSLIPVTLMMEVTCSSETLVLTRANGRNIPENGILHSHHHENLRSYKAVLCFTALENVDAGGGY